MVKRLMTLVTGLFLVGGGINGSVTNLWYCR